MARQRRVSGSVDQLPSGRYRVRVARPDGTRVSIGTFATKRDADAAFARALTATGGGQAATQPGRRHPRPLLHRLARGAPDRPGRATPPTGAGAVREPTPSPHPPDVRRCCAPPPHHRPHPRLERHAAPSRRPRGVERGEVLPAAALDPHNGGRGRPARRQPLHHQGRRHRASRGTPHPDGRRGLQARRRHRAAPPMPGVAGSVRRPPQGRAPRPPPCRHRPRRPRDHGHPPASARQGRQRAHRPARSPMLAGAPSRCHRSSSPLFAGTSTPTRSRATTATSSPDRRAAHSCPTSCRPPGTVPVVRSVWSTSTCTTSATWPARSPPARAPRRRRSCTDSATAVPRPLSATSTPPDARDVAIAEAIDDELDDESDSD